MKKAFDYMLGVFLLLFLLWAGTILFVVSFLIRLVFRRLWVAYAIALGLTVAITFYSSVHPDTFRFGLFHLRLHDHTYIEGFPSVLPSTIVNLIFAWMGVLVGSAARKGYGEGKSEQFAAGNRP